jgi:membrane protease YdiL (CAAX protease family)
LATHTLKLPRAFTREDGRERIAIPLRTGVLYAVGATILGFVATVLAIIALVVGAVLVTGNTPSMNPGHAALGISELVFYAMSGWLAWYGLSKTTLRPFRRLTRRDVRTIFIGIAGLIATRVGTGIVLVLTQQTKHVQAGFEHFDVTSKLPGVTGLSIVLAVASLVIVAPVVEEIVFRGLLFGALAGRLGVIGGALVTSLIFGLVHGDPVLFPSLAALGFISALAYAATGNLWVSIVLHALNNSLGAVFLVGESLTKH